MTEGQRCGAGEGATPASEGAAPHRFTPASEGRETSARGRGGGRGVSGRGTAGCGTTDRREPQKHRGAGGKATSKAKSAPSIPTKDPRSLVAKNRRERRISERLRTLQELVPNGTKVDLVTMLERSHEHTRRRRVEKKQTRERTVFSQPKYMKRKKKEKYIK
ncbi:uncharacterized protein C2845_PM07G00720 [Panicum miliaceum]|uniref:BHLH domain-containing protein n=1 Tax=Panicum miliaceum TaxID=4540 RepID=A0A3L6SL93_PANMI|nr:uncharacterized protein C2845_PM07G00720 [Panicum miliaceum]